MSSTMPTIPAGAREGNVYCTAIDGLASTNVSQTGYFRQSGLESNSQMAVGSGFGTTGPPTAFVLAEAAIRHCTIFARVCSETESGM